MATTTLERTEKGVSLARGPALILGTVLDVAGLYLLYKQHTFPPLSNFPNGDAPVQGKVFLDIFGANGWTGLFTAVAGGLLLFGAAQHLLAKAMSLIVGVALGAATVIAIISGNVLGLAATNGWSRLGWGVCAVILLFNTMVPRRKRTVTEVTPGATASQRADGGVVPLRRRPADDDRTQVMSERQDPGTVATRAHDGDRDTEVTRVEDREPDADTRPLDRAGPLDDRDDAADAAATRRHPADE